jgi:hypothetical protein
MGQTAILGQSVQPKWEKSWGRQIGFKSRWMALKIAFFRLIGAAKIGPDCARSTRKAQGVAQSIWVCFLFFIRPAQKISGSSR